MPRKLLRTPEPIPHKKGAIPLLSVYFYMLIFGCFNHSSRKEKNMKILVVVDMQNDFIDGALGTAEAVRIVDRVREKIDSYIKDGNCVIYTKDTHTSNYLQTAEGRHLPIEHCIEGTNGWEIAPGLYREGCEVVCKPTFGSFALAEKIGTMTNVEAIELVGLCTDICVISNALLLKACMPEVPIAVDSNGCAGVTPTSHQNALDAMRMCQITIL